MNARQTLSDAFETRYRENGEPFACLKDDAPEWCRDAVREAHDDALPNDWIYAACRDMAEALAESDSGDMEAVYDAAAGMTDPYTHQLLKWAADVPGALDACDEAASTFGRGADSIADMLLQGQRLMLETIGGVLAYACDEQDESEAA
jgi:hypothetical protein